MASSAALMVKVKECVMDGRESVLTSDSEVAGRKSLSVDDELASDFTKLSVHRRVTRKERCAAGCCLLLRLRLRLRVRATGY